MKSGARTNSLQYLTPTLVVFPQISSHEDGLLTQYPEINTSIHQPIYPTVNEYIKLNHLNEGVSIEAVRELQSTLSFATRGESLRVVAIFHLDTASIPAQNALLKLLEEPPAHTKIWLTATSLGPILPTILSRVEILHTSQNAMPDAEHADLQALVARIPQLSHRELIEIADTYSERDAAKRCITTALTVWHTLLTTSKDTNSVQKVLTLLTDAHILLTKNVNTKLVLEHTFFGMKACHSSNSL